MGRTILEPDRVIDGTGTTALEDHAVITAGDVSDDVPPRVCHVRAFD
jgi:hypothetical protein